MSPRIERSGERDEEGPASTASRGSPQPDLVPIALDGQLHSEDDEPFDREHSYEDNFEYAQYQGPPGVPAEPLPIELPPVPDDDDDILSEAPTMDYGAEADLAEAMAHASESEPEDEGNIPMSETPAFMPEAAHAPSTAGVAGDVSATSPILPVESPMRSDPDTVGGPSSSSAQPARHERETTGGTPVPSQNKIRTEADALNPSPLRSGFFRPAIGTAVRQPPIPEDSDSVAPELPTFRELVERDERDEAAAKPSVPQAATGPWGTQSPAGSRGSRSERGRPRIPRSGVRSGSRHSPGSSRSVSTISVRVECWAPGPTCPPTAENRCPGKAHKPGGPCDRPVCKACSGTCPHCSVRWLCEDCIIL